MRTSLYEKAKPRGSEAPGARMRPAGLSADAPCLVVPELRKVAGRSTVLMQCVVTELAISVDRCDSHGVNDWTFENLRTWLIAPGAVPGGYAGSLRNPCVDRWAKREKPARYSE